MTTIYIAAFYLFACEVADYFLARRRDAEVFPPKIGFRLVRWLGIAFCIAGMVSYDKSRSWTMLVFCAVLFIFWLHWPRTLLIDSVGISSRSAFGLFRRSIPWFEVNQVRSDWQEERFRFWTFMGYSVTVIGRDGRRIEHGLVNTDQGRFLDDLRRFLPREAFDAGLYEWHPDAPVANS